MKTSVSCEGGADLQVAAHASEVGGGGALLEGDPHPQYHVCVPHVLFQDIKHIVWRNDVRCSKSANVFSTHHSLVLELGGELNSYDF